MLWPGSLQNDHVVSSVTQVAVPTREIFGGIPVSSQPPAWTLQQRKQSSISSHIQDASRLLRLPRSGVSKRPLLDASFQLHDRTLLGQRHSRKWEDVNSAEYHAMLTRGLGSIHFGFCTPEGQLKVRKLITSAVVDSCADYIVKTCVLIERYVFDIR